MRSPYTRASPPAPASKPVASWPSPSPPQPARRISPGQPGRAAGLLHAWHLLSLDAPTVAVLWTAFFTHAHHRSLPSSELAALFLFVWLLYVADRLLDAWRCSGKAQNRSSRTTVSASLMPRHRFHLKHRRAFLAVAILAAAMLVPLTWRLPAPDLRLDLSLAAALVSGSCSSTSSLRAARCPRS